MSETNCTHTQRERHLPYEDVDTLAVAKVFLLLGKAPN